MAQRDGATGAAVWQALLAALLFGLNTPFSKLLLGSVPPMLLAGLLYLGAAAGMGVVWAITRRRADHREARLMRADGKWVVLMIVLDIAAPFLLLSGIARTTAANAALLTNFEMVTTTLVALLFFREAIGRRMWAALGVITLASLLLAVDFWNGEALHFSAGSLLVLAACACWGLENNCTRNLSGKDPVQVVLVKGVGSGTGALLLALGSERLAGVGLPQVGAALALGFVAYGLSILFYVRAQRTLGAARTSLYYAAAPFLGVGLSFLLLGEKPAARFAVAAVLMAAGVLLATAERHRHLHHHGVLAHDHRHSHVDGHHTHHHEGVEDANLVHAHPHQHEVLEHAHEHRPDLHHRHSHGKD